MKLRNLLMLAIAVLVMASCSDDDELINKSLVGVSVNMPKGFINPKIEEAVFTFENVNTGEKIEKKVTYIPETFIDVENGVYNIKVEGIVNHDVKTIAGLVNGIDYVRALQEKVEVVNSNFSVKLDFSVVKKSEGFVISEIFFKGTKTPEGKPYRYDKFFEIYNNSDKTLYADGLCIGEGEFNTCIANPDLTPLDIKTTKTALHAIYRVPGTGKQYPIEPGKTLVLADIAKNHKTDNANSIDLSKANFEWYDPGKYDVDVPEVPNLEKVVSYSRTIWTPHSRGYNAYVIFKLPADITAEKFAADNAIDYSYIFRHGDRVIPMNRNTWYIDTKDVIDAVECSAPEKFTGLAFNPSLDISYTFVDAATYGASVKRKIDHTTADGRIVLKDTNDSANDFISTAKNPSPGKVDDAK